MELICNLRTACVWHKEFFIFTSSLLKPLFHRLPAHLWQTSALTSVHMAAHSNYPHLRIIFWSNYLFTPIPVNVFLLQCGIFMPVQSWSSWCLFICCWTLGLVVVLPRTGSVCPGSGSWVISFTFIHLSNAFILRDLQWGRGGWQFMWVYCLAWHPGICFLSWPCHDLRSHPWMMPILFGARFQPPIYVPRSPKSTSCQCQRLRHQRLARDSLTASLVSVCQCFLSWTSTKFSFLSRGCDTIKKCLAICISLSCRKQFCW